MNKKCKKCKLEQEQAQWNTAHSYGKYIEFDKISRLKSTKHTCNKKISNGAEKS